MAGKKRLAKARTREEGIVTALKRQDALLHPVGENLSQQLRLFRIEVVETLLRGGIPLSKADVLRPLLEKHGFRLTTRSHLSELVPFVLGTEIGAVKEELFPSGPDARSRFVSVIFDGSTRLGEAIAVILRFVDENWRIQQRLVRIDVVARSVTGVALAQVLNECLSVDYRIRGDRLLAAMRDGASVKIGRAHV